MEEAVDCELLKMYCLRLLKFSVYVKEVYFAGNRGAEAVAAILNCRVLKFLLPGPLPAVARRDDRMHC